MLAMNVSPNSLLRDERADVSEESAAPQPLPPPPLRQPTGAVSSLASPFRHPQAQELPSLMDRIDRLGLTEEYVAFRDRYFAWRRGDAHGASGSLCVSDLRAEVLVAANRGFVYYYPNVQDWVFRRTMTFWITITFFEGSMLFTASSFLFNEKDRLGSIFDPLTSYGYCFGTVMFAFCCYLMCVECVNFGVQGDDEMSFTFYWNPFRIKTAMRRLKKAGAGVLPYCSSIVYLVGVGFFAPGTVVGFVGLPKDVGEQVVLILFLIGCSLFALGGVFEGLQNEVFTTVKMTKGWWSALLNVCGGMCFFLGAVAAWPDIYVSNLLYGVGSASYMVSSSIQIVMWKDEQFGLAFLSVLNQFDRPMVALPVGRQVASEAGFSWLGAFFVHVACVCGAASAYNFNIELRRSIHLEEPRAPELAVLELFPFVLAHLMLLLLAAAPRTPVKAPFRQLYILAKGFLLLMTAYCVFTLYICIAREA